MYKPIILCFFFCSHLCIAPEGFSFEEFDETVDFEALISLDNEKCPSHIDPSVWENVLPYLLPENHPARPFLDNIFTNTPFRITHNLDSVRSAGFNLTPRQGLRAIVIVHPDLPDYVIKIQLDSVHHSKEDWKHWVKRIQGAELIRRMIKKNGWSSTFKVAKKWIYVLPEMPFSAPGTQSNHFILIAENMNLLPRLESKAKWFKLSSRRVLDAFYKIVKKLGLRDCTRHANVSWCKDGRIAFVDTEDYFHHPVPYVSLNEYLNPQMREYWIDLTQKSAKK